MDPIHHPGIFLGRCREAEVLPDLLRDVVVCQAFELLEIAIPEIEVGVTQLRALAA